jgi:RimJ/RimL family protein N-acetyltransferase
MTRVTTSEIMRRFWRLAGLSLSAEQRQPDMTEPSHTSTRFSPRLIKARSIKGHHLVLRDAGVADARFIVDLRTDATKSKYISSTSPDVQQQVGWLERYQQDASQIYFIIEDAQQQPVGTVRIYDQRGSSFCWGSWIMKAGTPSSYAIESALMVYHYALGLGFDAAHFEVNKGNESVWKFHERFGAVRVDENAEEFHYEITLEHIQRSLKKYQKYLPAGIVVTP